MVKGLVNTFQKPFHLVNGFPGIRRINGVISEKHFLISLVVSTATEAVDQLHSTARSHEWVMAVEVMERHAGWITLNSGISGAAHVNLFSRIKLQTPVWRCSGSPEGSSYACSIKMPRLLPGEVHFGDSL